MEAFFCALPLDPFQERYGVACGASYSLVPFARNDYQIHSGSVPEYASLQAASPPSSVVTCSVLGL